MKSIFTSLFALMLAHPLHALTVTDHINGAVNYIWGYTEPCWDTCSAETPFRAYSSRYDNDMMPSYFWKPGYSADLGRLEKVSFTVNYSFFSGRDDFVHISTTPTLLLWSQSSPSSVQPGSVWIDGPYLSFSGTQGSSASLVAQWELDTKDTALFQAIMLERDYTFMELYGRSDGYAVSNAGENDDHGHLFYDMTVTYHISPVPLPASFPLLAVVVLGLGAVGIAAGRSRDEFSASACA